MQVQVLICFKLQFSIQENGWENSHLTQGLEALKSEPHVIDLLILVENLCGQGALLQLGLGLGLGLGTVSALK